MFNPFKTSNFMGKGDKKTTKGKIAKGSFGVKRPRFQRNKDAEKKHKVEHHPILAEETAEV
ncbi:hypothetical protein PEDI_31480 [Persicobacter diffluens]|uniref:30S ribosomal protein THX n=2 Tax=Persicobacter diffluens TaxID=981 RepID=A0AAN4W0R2_9BACT|nr:hypothetical protein PEDI_31480 [Persicobacter diffluens]